MFIIKEITKLRNKYVKRIKKKTRRRIKNKSKVLLIHGEQDEIVSSNFLLEAKDFFERNKIYVETNVLKNCGHNIPIEASSIALKFIKNNLVI